VHDSKEIGLLTMHCRSPFSTAQTQTELITMVKSGKLPSLPAHISPGLKGVIKVMLNLNVSGFHHVPQVYTDFRAISR